CTWLFFRDRHIDEIVEVHAAKLMLKDEASRGGEIRHCGDHVESEKTSQRRGHFLSEDKRQILAFLRVAGGKRQDGNAVAAARAGRAEHPTRRSGFDGCIFLLTHEQSIGPVSRSPERSPR